ncbi:hypothetical protein [Nonomuraea sp. NPDC005650]|uniref:hypothetical protein n=1 Tax=Nonomuraea sp. NPDC005650 TaxID=3157045 RepID=UPI0033A7BE30
MLEIGDVVAMPLPLGGFGACQVTAAGDELTVCVFDWHSDAVPALDDLRGAGPLIIDHHSWEGVPQILSVDASAPLPPGFVWLGRFPVGAGMLRSTSAYGGWPALSVQVVLQRQWDLRVPDEVKAAYKNAAPGQIEADFGARRIRRPAMVSGLDLRELHGEVRWAGLDALPRVTSLTWAGPDRGLAAALSSRPIVTALHWAGPPEEVDLGGTHLNELTFAEGSPRRLVLPPTLTRLRLGADGPPPELVTAAAGGRWIRLTTRSGVPAGLSGVREVALEVAGDVPLMALDGLAELESLRIQWLRPHGGLTGTAAFPRLHTLELIDAYGVEASMLPPPGGALRHLGVASLRSSQSGPIKQRYRGSSVEVRLRGAKSDKWLAANIDNPLRNWVDDDRRAGAAACRAYTVASEAIGRLSADDPGGVADARQTLREFVDRLNDLDGRHGLIDTLRREEAGDAFVALATRAGVPAGEAGSWFDEWRDF